MPPIYAVLPYMIYLGLNYSNAGTALPGGKVNVRPRAYLYSQAGIKEIVMRCLA